MRRFIYSTRPDLGGNSGEVEKNLGEVQQSSSRPPREVGA